jgi:hypothetical protein
MRFSKNYSRADGPLHRQPPKINKRLATTPERATAHVRLLFEELQRQGRVYDDLSEAAGVLRSSIKTWRNRSQPSLPSIEACLNALGWDLTPVPVIEILPPDIAADLAALAAKMQAGLPETFAALLTVALRQQENHERAAEQLAKIDAARTEVERERAERKRRRCKPANDNVKRAKTAV